MNEYNDIQIIGPDMTDMVPAQQNNGALLTTDHDNILLMAQKAEEYISAMNTIMKAALKITTENDWVLIGGKPYLQETGATKVARLFGISIQIVGHPLIETDAKGYKTYTYRARFMLNGQFVEAEGSRSKKDEFFAGKGCKKKPDEIDERDVRLAAYTNCVNSGIKKLIPGLRGLSADDLANAGFDMQKIGGYTFKTGSRGGSNPARAEDSGLTCSKCGVPITQAEASFSEGRFKVRLCRTCQKGA
jgi:hypothetical protein